MLDAGPTNPHTSLHLSGGLRVQRQVAGTNGEAPTSVGVSFLRCCPNSEAFVLIWGPNRNNPLFSSAAVHTIVISRRKSGAKMDFGMSAWTPRTMSTTWVTRKLTATLHSA